MAKVLVIDDEILLLAEIVDILRYEGFEVLQSVDGLNGVQSARDNLPDIIICDINMPEIDGYEVLEELRNDSLTAFIPFIFLSARATQTDIRIGMNLGADDYLTKPFDREELVNAIHTRLEMHSSYQLNRLREFSHQVVMAQEVERRNLSVALKDNLLNILSDLKLALNITGMVPYNAQESALRTAKQLADSAVDTINTLSYSLWPSVLTQVGLLPALLMLFDQFTDRTHIKIDFQYNALETISDPDITIAVYRIIQEALTNTEKHAGAGEAQIRLWAEQDNLRLQIEDRGVGFDVEAALSNTNKIGLTSMQERAYLVGGELTILSYADSGTRLIGVFPLVTEETTYHVATSYAVNASASARTLPGVPPQLHQGVSDNAIRIAIADSNEVTRWGIRNLLETRPEFTVVGEIADETGMMRFLEDIKVNTLILSLNLQGQEVSWTLIQKISQSFPNLRILLLSNYPEYTYATQALKNGAHGYILKTSSVNEVIDAVHSVSSGHQYVGKDIVSTLQGNSSTSQNIDTLDAFSTLTEREREIFYLVANGQTNREIAEKLVISPRTAETHRMNMMHKLGLKGTPALVHYAMGRGFMGHDTQS